MAQRRDRTLLLDVMRRNPTILEAPESPVDGDSELEPGAPPPRTWGAGSAPVLLRLPRGYAILMGIGILLLLILGYFAGYARGDRTGYSRAEAAMSQRERVERPIEERAGIWGPMLVEHPGGEDDPRLPGLSYFHLANYPKTDAFRLVEFLRGHGVAAFATRRNDDIFSVWAGQGFSMDDEARQARQSYLRHLGELGRDWGRRPYGVDTLPGINLQEYRP
ncbi:MAG: hypothetical protein JJU36_07675 [Phycisphaeraceae bacterium]|nr:hypothetical protein [Phycisphaeraceae bacterium]